MFVIGDRVEKYKGSYTAVGTVVSAFRTLAGNIRYVVQYDVPAGLLHIHSDSDLRSHSSTGQST